MSINNIKSNMTPIHNILEHIETKILNPVGRIPVIATISTAPLRAGLGIVQVVGGLAAIFFGSLLHNESAKYYGCHHFTHGVMNLCRAVVEFIPFINLMTMCYDVVWETTKEGRLKSLPSGTRFSYLPFEQPLEKIDLHQSMQLINPPAYSG